MNSTRWMGSISIAGECTLHTLSLIHISVEYLFGAGAGTFYRVLFVALMPAGAVMWLDLAWTLSDTFNLSLIHI